jgi:hypothetical protein
MTEFSSSSMVVCSDEDRLYTFQYAALMTGTSTITIEQFVEVGSIEPVGSMLRSREIGRIAQLQRLRQDLGLNLIGATMVLDLSQEIAQLRALLEVLRS